MIIDIEDYKNIKKISLNIEDKKINLLLGVSGSGKTSIAESLISEKNPKNVTIGESGPSEAKINGDFVDASKIAYFSSYISNNFLTFSDNKENFRVFIDSNQELKESQEIYNSLLKDFESNISKWDDIEKIISTIKKQIGSRLTNSNDFTMASAMKKFEKSFLSSRTSKNVAKFAESLPKGKFNWIIQGSNYIEDNRCPYCNKKLNHKVSECVKKYISYDAGLEEKMRLSPEQEKIVNVSEIPLITEFKKYKEQICKAVKAVDQYEEIKGCFALMNSDSLPRNYYSIISKSYIEAFELFPGIQTILANIKSQYVDFMKKIKKAKKLTSDCVRRNTRRINNLIHLFGVPYSVELSTRGIDEVSYVKLYHIKDTQKLERQEALSNGEKSIVSLAVWLSFHMKDKTKSLIILDDPITNYDDGKRQTMLSFLESFIKTENPPTVLLLSFDQVLAKLLLENKACGLVSFLSNPQGEASTIPINKESFISFEDIFKNKAEMIDKSNYLRKVLFVRSYCEEHMRGTVYYSYISGIYHYIKKSNSETATEITNKIKSFSIEEEDILLKFEEQIHVHMPCFNPSLIDNSDVTSFSLFEKAFIARERVPDSSPEKKELSNLIHLNSTLLICLNPYSFSLCSGYVFSILKQVNGIMCTLPVSFKSDFN